MKNLDDYIIEIFSMVERGDKLRWCEVRNELLKNEAVNPDFALTKKSSSFNVKVARALQRLTKRGILESHDEGHKNTSYSLTEDASNKLLTNTSTISLSYLAVGLFAPDDFLNLSYEQIKDKLVKHLVELYEDEWKKDYEENRKYIIEKKKRKG